jgi:hypothetical protein
LKVEALTDYVLLFGKIVPYMKEVTMAASESTSFRRLEDFIVFAGTGAKLHASLTLEKQLVTQKVPHEKSEEKENELDMYLLTAVFTFKMEGGDRMVSKVYLLGSTRESAHDSRVHVNIANARLTADYKRLRDAHITIEDKLFNFPA